jgi:hypothetical protein
MPPKPKFKKENDVATRSEIEALFRPSDEMVEALDQVFEEAVRKGIIVDSGRGNGVSELVVTKSSGKASWCNSDRLKQRWQNLRPG